jgi:hypothetical protein
MSYDLAVWEGERPDDDEAAMKFYMERIVPQLEEYDPKNPITPTPRIRAYVEALLECWPDIQAEDNGSPWSTGPLMREAVGGLSTSLWCSAWRMKHQRSPLISRSNMGLSASTHS